MNKGLLLLSVTLFTTSFNITAMNKDSSATASASQTDLTSEEQAFVVHCNKIGLPGLPELMQKLQSFREEITSPTEAIATLHSILGVLDQLPKAIDCDPEAKALAETLKPQIELALAGTVSPAAVGAILLNTYKLAGELKEAIGEIPENYRIPNRQYIYTAGFVAFVAILGNCMGIWTLPAPSIQALLNITIG